MFKKVKQTEKINFEKIIRGKKKHIYTKHGCKMGCTEKCFSIFKPKLSKERRTFQS